MPRYIEIGFTAERDPKTREFLPAVPLYAEATDEIVKSEATLIQDIAKVFAEHMKQYIDAGGIIGTSEKKAVQKEVCAEISGCGKHQ